MNNLCHRILKSNYHQPGGLKTLEIFHVAQAYLDALKDDAWKVIRECRPSVVTDAGHVTNWTKPVGDVRQYSIYNQSGETDDTSGDHNRDNGHKRLTVPECGAFKFLVDRLRPVGLMGMRLNILGPHSRLSPHEEHIVHSSGKAVYLRARFHLPIVSNIDAWAELDGEKFRLMPGSIYYFNNGCVHSSANEGTQFRAHLVWDMPLSQECYRLMFEGGLADGKYICLIPHRDLAPIGVVPVDGYETYRSDVGDYEYAAANLEFAR